MKEKHKHIPLYSIVLRMAGRAYMLPQQTRAVCWKKMRSNRMSRRPSPSMIETSGSALPASGGKVLHALAVAHMQCLQETYLVQTGQVHL